MADISNPAVEGLAAQLERRDEEHLAEADRHSWNAADTLRAQAAEIERLQVTLAVTLAALDRAAHALDKSGDALDKMVRLQAQLATARREGAEEMREKAAETAYTARQAVDCAPEETWVQEYQRAVCSDTILALPLPGDAT